jgi:hypothetical protein
MDVPTCPAPHSLKRSFPTIEEAGFLNFIEEFLRKWPKISIPNSPAFGRQWRSRYDGELDDMNFNNILYARLTK